MGDGFGDDGTLWIEKQFAVSTTMPTHIDLDFQLFNLFQGDFGTFEVKAAISTENPKQQADFTTIGSTDTAEGWVPFCMTKAIITSPSGQVWVALGIRVSFETHRDYWIDHVIVSTTEAIPEPSTALPCFICWLGRQSARSRAVDVRLLVQPYLCDLSVGSAKIGDRRANDGIAGTGDVPAWPYSQTMIEGGKNVTSSNHVF